MIPLIKNTFYRETSTKQKLCTFIKKARILSFGKYCEQFEKKFAAWQGRADFVMVNSGSSANLAIVQSLLNLGKLKAGDRIGFSAVTWSTNVMPFIELGLVPTPIDVSINSLNITPAIFTQALKKYHFKALFLTNLLGFCDDIEGIRKICRKAHIILIEDNCESLGSTIGDNKLGNFGLASSFSFYVGHHLSTIEGGGIATDDEELAMMLRLVRAHGWDRNLTFAKQTQMRRKFRINSKFYSRYTFYDLGYNFRPTEINAYTGLVQLPYLDEIINHRQQNFLYLASKIYAKNELYYPINFQHMSIVSNFAVPLICRSTAIRDRLVKRCNKKIEIRPIVGGDITQQPFFRKYITKNGTSCPNAELIHNQGLYFGNHPELTRREMDSIISLFTEV
jgi:CDP-4-dehydro-6-deoxyglucose reductase, E1